MTKQSQDRCLCLEIASSFLLAMTDETPKLDVSTFAMTGGGSPHAMAGGLVWALY
jgi:hypothetical protein